MDAAFYPKQFRILSEAIIEKGLNFKWWCFGRIMPGWDRELFCLGHKAGCRYIDWGLEHVNHRVTHLIGKPTDKELALKVIFQCRFSGITPLVQTITGFPTETEEECRELLDFLEKMIPCCFSVPQIFSIAKDTPFYYESRDYGISLAKDAESDFADTFHYDSPVMEKIRNMVQEYKKKVNIYKKTYRNRCVPHNTPTVQS